MERAELVGIEIGGTKLQIVAGMDPTAIGRRWRGVVRAELGGPGIQRQILAGLGEIGVADSMQAPRAVGVGFGGPVDCRTGTICRSHQIDGWENFELAEWLRGTINAPVIVENDANTGSLGEACFGAGAGFDPVFYVTLGSGVGGGLVVGGNIYHGAPPGEAEFGHLRLGREGATVESRCSGWSIDARIRDALGPGHAAGFLAAAVARQASPGGEARHLGLALAAEDPLARRTLDELSADLALALSHVVHLLHPAAVVLGGGLSLIGEPLRSAVAATLPGFVMEVFHPVPAVRLAMLGEDAVPAGALELARRMVEHS
jgi:glucokinase